MSLRALAMAALLLVPGLALAGGRAKKQQRKPKPAPAKISHPFADEPVAKLQVVDTRAQQAVVENKSGEVVLVQAGDLLAAEGFQVEKVSRGCIQLKGPESTFSMCADVPEVPRT